MYFRCYCVYVDNSVRAILRIWSLTQGASSGSHYINYVPSQFNAITFFNLKVKDLIERISAAIGLGRQLVARYTPHLKRNTVNIIRLALY
jgi:hypothetical protein